MYNINPKPIMPHVPLWEFEMKDLPEDDFFKSDTLWKSNNFKSETGGLYQDSTRLAHCKSQNTDEEIQMSKLLDRLDPKNVVDIFSNLFDENEELFYPQYPYVKTKYKSNKEFIKNFITSNAFAVKDNPTFELPPHVDNRFIFGNIIYNLVDNKTSTKIYGFNNEVAYEAPKEKGKGIIFLNTERTLHGYENNTDENRYAVICNIYLNVFIN
jgi:hypothetical protein